MANVVGSIPIGADTRPLERDISNALNKNYQLKGLNEKAFSQPLGRITGAVDEFKKSLDASNARVLAFGASAGAIFAIQKGFENLIRTTINVQKNLTDINSILGLSSKNLTSFGDQLFKVAGQTGQSFEAVSQAAVEFSRQGLGVEETLKRTRDALILTRLSGLDVVSSTEALTATINSFNKAALDSTEIVNKLATVDAAFAVSSGDLAQAIQRVGSSAESVGVNFDQLIALITSVQQTTARGGAVIGNSLKTIFTRLERTEVLDQLEQLGLQVRNLDGSFRPAIDTLTQLSQRFDGLSDSQRANVAELVGGVFQINILKAALGDLSKEYSTYNSALNTSSGATDAAVKRNEQLNQTLSALINKTLANFTKLGSEVGNLTLAPAIQNVLGNINTALESFSLSDAKGPGEKLAKGFLEGLGNYISGPGLALIGAVVGKLFINLAKFSTQAVGQILELNKGSQQQAQIQERINSILAQNPNLIQGILSKELSLLEVENQILSVIRAQTTARQQSAAVSATLTTNLIGRGVTSTGGKITAKSSGFIPNFSSSEQAEVYGAYLGGYKPGSVSKMNIPGEGQIVYNKAEQVKQFAGMSQPAIIPPEGSSAGRNYAEAFEKKLGFNPYAAMGYIPNFATASNEVIRANENNLQRIGNTKKFAIGETGLTASQSEIQKALAAKSKTTSVLDANGIATMLVPHGGMTSPIGSYTFDNGLTVKWPVRTYGSRSETGIRDVYQEIEKGVATGTIKYASSIKPPASVPNGPSVISAIKRTPGAAGALGAAAGAAFEVGMGLALGAESAAVEGVNFDVLTSNPELKKLFGYNTPLADFKINDSSAGNRKSMAEKIISASGVLGKEIFSGNQENLINRQASVKQFIKSNNVNKSSGFIPNYSPLMQSIAREISAGVSPGSVRVGQDSRLSNSQNPMGLGIYNTKDEPAGLSQGIARFKDLNSARISGAAKGYIPNYAFKDRLQSSALAASIGIPIAGGVAQQFIPEENVRTRAAISGLSNAASFTATGAAVGGFPGAIIGGLVGLITTLNDLDKAANQEGIDKFKKRLEQSQEDLNKLNDSFSQFNAITDKLRNSAGLSANDIGKLQQKLGSTLASIPENLRQDLIGAYGKGDTLKIQSIQTEALEVRQQEQKQLEYQTAYATYKAPETLQEAMARTIGLQGAEGRVKPGALNATTGTVAVGKFSGQLTTISDLVSKQFDEFYIADQKAGETIDQYSERYKNLVEEFIKDPKKLQAIAESTARQIEEAGLKSGNYGAALEQANQLRKNPELIIQSIKGRSAGLSTTAAALKNENEAQAFTNVIDGYLNNITKSITETNLNFTNAETEVQINLKKLQSGKNSLLENAKLFFGEFSNINIESQLNEAEANLKYQADLLQENRSIREKLGPNLFGETLSGLAGKNDPGTKAFAGVIKNASDQIQNIPLDQVNEYLNGLIGQLKEYADGSAKYGKETVQAAQSLINSLTRTQYKELPESQARLKQLQDIFSAEKEIRLKEIQQRIQFTKDLQTISFGGGLESLRRNDINARSSQFGTNRYLYGSQNPTTRGRGALGMYDELKQFGVGPQTVNPELRKAIIEGQSQNLLQLSKAFGININQKDATDIATKQFESLNKTEVNIETIKTKIEDITTKGIELGSNTLNTIAPNGKPGGQGGVSTSLLQQLTGSTKPLGQEAQTSLDQTIKQIVAEQEGNRINQNIQNQLNNGTNIDAGEAKTKAQDLVSLAKQQVEQIQKKYVGEEANSELAKEYAQQYETIVKNAQNYNAALSISNEYQKNLESTLSRLDSGEINILQARIQLNRALEESNTQTERANELEKIRVEHAKDLKDLADGYLSSTEYANKELERQQGLARRPGYNSVEGITTNFVNSMSYNGTQLFQDLNQSATDVARNIQDSFSNALMGFANSTQSAGDAFNDFAVQVLQQVQQISTQIATKLLFGGIFNQFQGLLGGGGGGGLGSLFGFSRGGLVKGYASGGYVKDGSGIVDDVPAMLSKGEYVLNKRAVRSVQQAYGMGFLESLNVGSTKGMADGGGISRNFDNKYVVTGYENTAGLNTKDLAGGIRAEEDYLNQLKGQSVTDPNLSNYALSDPTSRKNEERMQTEQDFYDYVSYIQDNLMQNKMSYVQARSAYEEALNAYNQRKSNLITSGYINAAMAIGGGLLGSMGGGGLGSLFGGGGGGLSSLFGGGGGASAYALPGGMGGTTSALGSNYGAITSLYGGAGGTSGGGLGSLFSSKNLPTLGLLAAGGIGSPFLQNALQSSNRPAYNTVSNTRSNGLEVSNRFRFADGGQAGDDVPALLMNGEYVVNKEAVKKYGSGFFEKLNKGSVNKFAKGGQVGSTQISTVNEDPSNYLIEAINNLTTVIQTTNTNNQLNKNPENVNSTQITNIEASKVNEENITTLNGILNKLNEMTPTKDKNSNTIFNEKNIEYTKINQEQDNNLPNLINALTDLNTNLSEKKSSEGMVNNINISVNIEADNKVAQNQNSSSSGSGDDNSNDSTGNRESSQKYKALTELIKTNVITTIIEQKRPGGLLNKNSPV
jgi:TP901 family phage tail tape measure protein